MKKSAILLLETVRKHKIILALLVLLGMIFETFFLKGFLDIVVYFLLSCWVVLIYAGGLKTEHSFYGSLFFLALSFFLSFTQKYLILSNCFLENSTKWFYLLLLAGAIKQIIPFNNIYCPLKR